MQKSALIQPRTSSPIFEKTNIFHLLITSIEFISSIHSLISGRAARSTPRAAFDLARAPEFSTLAIYIGVGTAEDEPSKSMFESSLIPRIFMYQHKIFRPLLASLNMRTPQALGFHREVFAAKRRSPHFFHAGTLLFCIFQYPFLYLTSPNKFVSSTSREFEFKL